MVVGHDESEGISLRFLETLVGGQRLELTLFRLLFSIDILSTSAGAAFSEWLYQEGEDKKESTS